MKTIMVVDDEENILEEVKKSLEEEDFEVLTVENTRKALEIIDEDKENKIELILIDTKLPDSNVPAFFSINPKLKTNIEIDKEENFLKKPFTKEQLIEFVRKKI